MSSAPHQSDSKAPLRRAARGGSDRRAPGQPPPPPRSQRRNGRPAAAAEAESSPCPPFVAEPSARRPLCQPDAPANGSLRRRQQQQQQQQQAAPRRGRPRPQEPSQPSSSPEGEQDWTARGSDWGSSASSPRAAPEALLRANGKSPAAKPGVDGDPLVHQLRPVLSAVFGQGLKKVIPKGKLCNRPMFSITSALRYVDFNSQNPPAGMLKSACLKVAEVGKPAIGQLAK